MIRVGFRELSHSLQHEIQQLEINMDYVANKEAIVYEETLPRMNFDANRDHRVEENFMRVAKYVNLLQLAKNVYYDNSWSKRGLLSMFFNMERKWERIAAQIANTASMDDLGDHNGETFVDTCVDLAAYSMKLCAWVFVRRPDLYKRFLETLTSELEKAKMLAPQPLDILKAAAAVKSCEHGPAEVCDNCRPHGVHSTF